MEPRVDYAMSRDGARIAFAVAGEGPPVLRMQGGLWDHATGYWRVRPFAAQLERLASSFTHVQYDSRGTGLSERGDFDFSLEAQIRDAEAVVEAAGLERFAIIGHTTGSIGAIAYAARHPDQVSKLVLLQPHVRGIDYMESVPIKAFSAYRSVADRDWQGYIHTIANRAVRFQDARSAAQLARVYDESMTPTTVRAFEEQYRGLDVTHMLGAVMATTLIIIATSYPLGEGLWREVADGLRDSRVVEVTGELPLAWLDETTSAIEEFLHKPRAGVRIE